MFSGGCVFALFPYDFSCFPCFCTCFASQCFSVVDPAFLAFLLLLRLCCYVLFFTVFPCVFFTFLFLAFLWRIVSRLTVLLSMVLFVFCIVAFQNL